VKLKIAVGIINKGM